MTEVNWQVTGIHLTWSTKDARDTTEQGWSLVIKYVYLNPFTGKCAGGGALGFSYLTYRRIINKHWEELGLV